MNTVKQQIEVMFPLHHYVHCNLGKQNGYTNNTIELGELLAKNNWLPRKNNYQPVN